MAGASGVVLGFAVEWYDPVACDVKDMFLKFWPEDNTLELVRFLSLFFFSDALSLSSLLAVEI